MTNTIATTDFSIPLSQIWQDLGFSCLARAGLELKLSSLKLDKDYIETETECFLNREGLKKFCLIAQTPIGQAARDLVETEQLALPPKRHESVEGVEELPAVDPNINFWVDRENEIVWGKVDDHCFTVKFDGHSAIYFNVPEWTKAEGVVGEDGQLKPEIKSHALKLVA